MSRYLLLFLLNLPFILAGLLSSTTQYKLKKISKKRYVFQSILWLSIALGLGLVSPIYNFLYNHELTNTEPLSLFDVIQITAIILIFYLYSRVRQKLENTEKRLSDLHQELSIRLSSNK